MKIGVIDYGMGNLFSVEQALKRLGVEVLVTADQQQLAAADAVVLPGVGAFPDAMKRLEETKLVDFIYAQKEANKPLLGICLGMQLLFEHSVEVAPTKGLGIFTGTIERFNGVSRIPHMGWNDVALQNEPQWLQNATLPEARHVYFVHSFYATNIDEQQLVAYADYEGVRVPGIVSNGSFTGMQFHPEKSGELGVALLQSWLEGVKRTC
ncbi:imidazole glycerol phosphate synthase subunit HisH [Caryophanon tenue]|uniref:Imidazole glycerol phosphate synthase subunit HisH n=1 Tax=Caryophanon tenue TaxID=33978 RepID=A0A1C0YJE5_9BACL|nr:imidazole glycerol phosphate synthase subunit HisH [Caryophanon tenue]OCS87199.1 imidazole glycerol phosphate synthase, glutamine amidotransferase subunit [Caryophanon tenue]